MTAQPATWQEAPQFSVVWRAVGKDAEDHMSGMNRPIELTINKAFLAARLLTGSVAQAERAVIEAVESWAPDENSEKELFQFALSAAIRVPREFVPASDESPADKADISPALRRVLRLSPELRQPFVLRLLVGLSRKACAGLLGLSCAELDEYTCAAVKRLASLSQEPARAVASFA